MSNMNTSSEQVEHVEHLRQRLQLAIRGSGFGVWEYDLDSGKLIWDAQMYRIYGQAEDSPVPLFQRWQQCLHPQDAAQVDEKFQSLMAGAVVDLFEFRITRASDSVERHIEANGYVQRDVNGQPQRLVGMNRDVTERWRANELVRLLGNSLPQLHDIVLVVENQDGQARGRLRYANSAFFETSGYGLTDLDELGLRALLSPHADMAEVEVLRSSVAKLRTYKGELLGRSKSGIDLWFDVTLSPVPDDSGAITHWVLVAHGISERKAAEAAALKDRTELERRVAERTQQLHLSNQELEAFTRSVAHDLRGPLRGICGWSQALQQDCGHLLDPAGTEHLHYLRGEAERMSELLDGLLRLSRIAQSDLCIAVVDLSRMAIDILQSLAQEDPQRRCLWHVELEIRVQADSPLLFLALNNLLRNAWKFTEPRTIAQIDVRAIAADAGQRVEIRDNGVGFDSRYAREILHPFRRLHRNDDFPGTGVGLATVDLIMRRHGGTLLACGTPNAGASFVMCFPATQQ